jgi:hypothetical protein
MTSNRSMNVYLQESNYDFLKSNIPPKKISQWINQAILERRQKLEPNVNDLIAGYQAMAEDRDLAEFSNTLTEESLACTVYDWNE